MKIDLSKITNEQREFIKKQISYDRQLELCGKRKADNVFYFAMIGFQSCQELNKEKQFTLDDMKKAYACGIDICVKEGGNDFQPFEDLINSITPPTN